MKRKREMSGYLQAFPFRTRLPNTLVGRLSCRFGILVYALPRRSAAGLNRFPGCLVAIVPSSTAHSTGCALSTPPRGTRAEIPSHRVRHVRHHAQLELLPRCLGPARRCRVPDFVSNQAFFWSPELLLARLQRAQTNPRQKTTREPQSGEERAFNPIRRCTASWFAYNETRWSPEVPFAP